MRVRAIATYVLGVAMVLFAQTSHATISFVNPVNLGDCGVAGHHFQSWSLHTDIGMGPVDTLTWAQAHAFALAQTYDGMQGHLWTIRSCEEVSRVTAGYPANFLGAARGGDGQYYWVDGALAGQPVNFNCEWYWTDTFCNSREHLALYLTNYVGGTLTTVVCSGEMALFNCCNTPLNCGDKRVIVEYEPAATGAPLAGASTTWLGRPEPNPSAGPFVVRFALAPGETGAIAIYDATGRRVRDLASSLSVDASGQVSWDGLTQSGTPARGGVYFVRLLTTSGVYRRTLVKLQ